MESPLGIILVLFLVGLLVYAFSGALRRKNIISEEKERTSSNVGAIVAVFAAGALLALLVF